MDEKMADSQSRKTERSIAVILNLFYVKDPSTDTPEVTDTTW